MKHFYLFPLTINKDKYLSAYRPAANLSMYHTAQTIKAFSHIGGWVVKIVPEGGAEWKHLLAQLTGLIVALVLKVLRLPVIVILFLPDIGSQYWFLNLSQQEENCFLPVPGDIAWANNRMLYKLDYSPGKITAVSCHFPATFRQVITSPPDAGPSPVFSYKWFWTQNYPAKSGKTICIRPKDYVKSSFW